jgi:hypothetical protein
MVCALPMQRVSTPSSMTAQRDGGLGLLEDSLPLDAGTDELVQLLGATG